MTIQTDLSYPKKALFSYRDRGKKLLSLFLAGEEESAVEWISLHRAAFHNFLAVEAKYGLCEAEYSDLTIIWREIESINNAIMMHAQVFMQEAQSTLISIQRERNRLRKFRSFSAEETTFQRSI